MFMSKKIRKLLMLVIVLGIMWILPNKVKANTLTISAANTTLAPGQTTTITVSSDSIGRVNLSVSGNAAITGDRVWVEGNSQSFTLTAKGAGTVTLTATPENPMSLNGNKVELSPATCTINVKEASTTENTNSGNSSGNSNGQTATKSNVATLSNLGITPNDFKGFTASKTNYSVTVPNSVSSIEVYAKKGQSGQTVSGTGKKTLQEGANTFNVVVTAEDGKTKKTYTIVVNREAAKEEKTENKTTDDNTVAEETTKEEEPKEETKIGLSNLKIAGVTLNPTFKEDVYEYTAKLIGDKTSLDIDTTALDESEKIEITGNEDLKEGENVVTVLVSDQNGENTVSYQIVVNKSLIDEEAVAKEKQVEEREKQKRLIIIGITVAAIVIVVVILVVRHRKNAQYDMEYTQPYFEEDWENQNKNKIENNVEDNAEYQQQEEKENKPRKKKASKGKRFK